MLKFGSNNTFWNNFFMIFILLLSKETKIKILLTVLQILDEVYRILYYIKVTPKLQRPYKVTDELFDLSTMAMEYFKEYIEPTLPEIPYFGADFLDLAGTFSCK